ncbi:glycosyl transferase [Philodulcilactobacillus myokoensis]|uniref:Glycosyl transferase n=2 Tax=Philodulcilactobacillus myokoensis TaxID=2929573 RepID=A0A9W6ET90_9LACO|nr:glycosyl transferase [Philodulcilactobacillus myokoensis]
MIYRNKYEKPSKTLKKRPLVSILVPAHNEHDTLQSAVDSISKLNYKNFELVLIDDKSSDDTLRIMGKIKREYSKLFPIKIVKIPVNQGKANAMNQGSKHADGEYIMGIDADSILDRNSLNIIVDELNRHPDVGAVAGKPVVRNRTTVLGRLQLLEYVGVIDIIKKAQSFITGRITTVSGVIVGFRKKAIQDVHGWNPKVMTEDIDITWRLYRHNWEVRYDPNIVCWILVPENIKNLIKQRRRWARGGLEVLFNNRDMLLHGAISERLLLTETIVSDVWAILTTLSTISYVFSLFTVHAVQLDGDVLLVLLLISCLQFLIGFFSSRKNAYMQFVDLLLVPIYVIFYWMINLISCIAAIISFILDPQHIGTWRSPDRGR